MNWIKKILAKYLPYFISTKVQVTGYDQYQNEVTEVLTLPARLKLARPDRMQHIIYGGYGMLCGAIGHFLGWENTAFFIAAITITRGLIKHLLKTSRWDWWDKLATLVGIGIGFILIYFLIWIVGIVK